MKSYIILGAVFLLTATLYSYDGAGGASLNRSQTIEEYGRLSDLSDKALKTGDKKVRDEAVDGIEDFLHVIDEYSEVSSSGAKKFLNMYGEDLSEKLQLLNEIK